MELRDWRISKGWSQGRLGKELGLPLESQWSQAERVENGKIKVDADLVAAIERLTEGAVTADDMHRTRLGFLERSGKARDFSPPADLAEAS